jgi:glycosyltransferase involved in cell wall biosynthesis
MPRVLFVHHRPQAGGAVRSLALLIEALSDEWEAHVLVPRGLAADEFAAAGATVHLGPVPAFVHTWDVQYRGLRWLVALRETASVPLHRRRLRQLLRELRPALVHVNDGVMLATGLIAASAGAPVVWHLRSSLPNDGRDRRSRLISRLIDRTGTAAIAIDSDVARTFALRIPVHIVHNPVVARVATPAEPGIMQGRIAIGYLGYLRRQKGWPEFLGALRLLLDEGVPVHGVFVGGAVRPHSAFRGLRGRVLKSVGVPDEERDFERELDRLDLGAHVARLPYAPDLAPIYAALDVVVFPNQGAGLGRPVLEAAAHGLPVVASGSPDGAGVLVDGETGILLDRGDSESVANAVRRLVEDELLRRRFGEEAAARAASWNPEIVVAAVEQAWQSALLRITKSKQQEAQSAAHRR